MDSFCYLCARPLRAAHTATDVSGCTAQRVGNGAGGHRLQHRHDCYDDVDRPGVRMGLQLHQARQSRALLACTGRQRHPGVRTRDPVPGTLSFSDRTDRILRITVCVKEKSWKYFLLPAFHFSLKLAEREGFEPPVPCDTQHFQCCAIDQLGHLSN